MKNDYDEVTLEIKEVEKIFREIANEINKYWNSCITLFNSNVEYINEYDARYPKLCEIYNKINELEHKRKNLLNELKCAPKFI